MNRDIATTLSLAALAQIVAFGKSVLVAYYFGIGATVDGYYLAQVVPVTLAGIVSGFLQTGFLTVYAGHLVRDETAAAAALLGRTLGVVAMVGSALSVAIAIAAPWLIHLLAPGATSSASDSATFSLRALAFLLVLNSLVDCLNLALNAHRSFAIAALAPTVNALVATGLLAAAPDWGLANLVAGTLLGVIAQALLIAYGLRINKIQIIWWTRADLKEVMKAGSSIVPGLVFANTSAAVPTLVAAGLGEGAVAALSVAMRLHGAATQVFTMALSTVLLPHFALAVGRADFRFIRNWLVDAFPIAAMVAIAALLWVGLQGRTFVSLAFERGAFDQTATVLVGSAWYWLTFGLLPSIWGVTTVKVLQAFRLGATISVIAFFSLLFVIVLSLGLSSRLGISGLALAPGIAATAVTFACTLVANRRLPLAKDPSDCSTSCRIGFFTASAAALISLAFLADFFLRDCSLAEQAFLLAAVLVVVIAAIVTTARRRAAINNRAPLK